MEDQLMITELQDKVTEAVNEALVPLVGEKGAYAAVVLYKPENQDGANIVASGLHLTKEAAETTALISDVFVRAMQNPGLVAKLQELVQSEEDVLHA